MSQLEGKHFPSSQITVTQKKIRKLIFKLLPPGEIENLTTFSLFLLHLVQLFLSLRVNRNSLAVSVKMPVLGSHLEIL